MHNATAAHWNGLAPEAADEVAVVSAIGALHVALVSEAERGAHGDDCRTRGEHHAGSV